MNTNKLFLVDNVCYYKKMPSEKLYKIIYSKDVLKYGKVADSKKFIHETNSLLSKKKLINIFVNQNLSIIINDNYTKEDINALKDCLEKLNFKIVNIQKESEALNLEKYDYISFNKEYICLYYNNIYKEPTLKFIEKNFFLNERDLIKYIKSVLNTKKDIIIYGNNCKEEYCEKFSSKSDAYMAENPETYILLVNTN